MITSFINLLFRNFYRNLSFSLITLSSLVVGITTALLLMLWINYEVTYDHDIIDRERIYALLFHENVEGEIHTEEGTRLPMMDFLIHDVPEVEAVTRNYNKKMVLSYGEKSIHQQGVYGDSAFFKVHIPGSIKGNSEKSLIHPQSIAISYSLAHELFGEVDPLGKTILIDKKNEFMVTAVYESYPQNSHFKYIHFVLPFSARPPDADDWVNHDVKLWNASTREVVEKKIDQKIREWFPQDKGQTKSMLFAVSDWRLHWSFENGKVSGGRITYITIFAITGLLVLVMACINYMNIATARATRRAREIGVRKMTGATQANLIRQFLLESLLMTSLAAAISFIIAYLVLPLFNELVGISLELSLRDASIWIGLMIIIMFTTLLAGIYPAFVLSAFKPATVLKGNLHWATSGSGLRKALVVFQFSLSVVIIFCAVILWQQTNFLLKKDLGYDKHRVINVWLDENLKPSFESLRNMVVSHSSVEDAAFGGASPMEVNGYAECNRVSAPFANPLLFYGVNIDDHLLSTLRFNIIKGRNFSHDLASDSSNFIITQKAADLLGLENPIGQRISYNMYSQQEGEIVGVINDFQNDDIHTAAKPVVLVMGQPQYMANLFVRYREGQLNAAVNHLQTIFKQLQPDTPLNYSFLDTDFESQLHREKLMGNISIAFTIVAISIACLGLFGLVLFNTQRRVKEIGIRKVLGASVHQVVVLLSRDFFVPVLYAFLIAFPIAYYLMETFLESYPSRISIDVTTGLAVGGTLITLVLITAAYHSVKAARENPVKALKTE